MKTVILTEMTDSEFDALVQTHYGRDFTFVADRECGNDTVHTFSNITGKVLDRELDRIIHFKARGTSGSMSRLLLEDMVRGGHLPAGDYLITVSSSIGWCD